ncbi:hypothetical protein J7E97_08315 [Streptomyces sp. ISL-66]|uniref:hypothetical protein n=1 Tax=Streptomyces sp. ISL-66 TaxID=2819186 RepID=UPI001BEAC581|nr:hypothetical protein [Streptomyces sp. ISL-66]MBT2467878.1 hypothetical protein [Streptomyces sp. ISL-66]
MSPTSSDRGAVRSAAEVNAEIRALVAAGLAGTPRYQRLLEEWAAAIHTEVEPAA